MYELLSDMLCFYEARQTRLWNYASGFLSKLFHKRKRQFHNIDARRHISIIPNSTIKSLSLHFYYYMNNFYYCYTFSWSFGVLLYEIITLGNYKYRIWTTTSSIGLLGNEKRIVNNLTLYAYISNNYILLLCYQT